MSNVISFLETMGQSALLRRAGTSILYNALIEHQVSQDAQWAILRGDNDRLENLLNSRKALVCLVALPDADNVEWAEQATHLAASAR